jgi:hypothetical protein
MNEQAIIEYQTCNLCQAMLRNINDNFLCVSFDLIGDRDIVVRIALAQRTEIEEQYVDDMMAEFSSLQESNCVKPPEIQVGQGKLPLRYLVYRKLL